MYDRQTLAEGLELLAAGDKDGAEKCFLEIADGSPLRGEAMAQLGRLYLDDGQIDAAIACLLEAVIHVREPRVLKDLGDCMIVLERYGEAERALRESLELDMRDAEGWALLGRTLVLQDRLDEGVVAFEQAVLCDGRFAPARYFLADALIRQGETVRATGQLHVLLALDPGNPPALVLKGDLAFGRGEYRQAIAEYQLAIGKDALGIDGFEKLATACQQVGDLFGAVEAWLCVIARNSGRSAAWLNAARTCEEHKLYRRALLYYQAAGNGEESAAGIARIEEYYAVYDLSGQGGMLPGPDEELEPLDALPRGNMVKPPPPPPPGRFGRRAPDG
jgi:tetratricopeptide (TPR) repeat protein